MRTLLNSALAAVLGALIPMAWAQANAPTSSVSSGVSGEIRLLQQKSGRPAKDRSGAVVWLVPLDPLVPVRLGASKETYRMIQHDKQFHPHLLVVPLGAVVVFPNLDPWFHNVFSLYRGKRFDLGLYEAGSQKAVRFDKLGASYIFCNIHPEMMAVILTVDTPYYAITDKAGHWSIPSVPSGRYQLHVWYEDAAPNALQALDRVVEMGSRGAVLTTVVIRVIPHDWLKHMNLYGRKYDPKTLAPVY